MAESLWNAAEEYLAAQILAGMGTGSDYTTLQMRAVKRWAQFDTPELDKLGNENLLPATILTSFRSTAVPAGHSGPGTLNRQNTYFVVVAGVTKGSREQATADAKTIIWRYEDLFATLRFSGVAADDGSKASRIISSQETTLFRSEVALWPIPSSQADMVYGLGIVAFAVTGVTV